MSSSTCYKACSCCGAEYGYESWGRLPLANPERPRVRYEYGPGEWEELEMRNCARCPGEGKSTLAVLVASEGV